jgi:hypothetical protein
MENKPVKPPAKAKRIRARGESAPARTPLAPEHWVEIAIDLLANEGIAGLRVEVLAKRCGVTKGISRIGRRFSPQFWSTGKKAGFVTLKKPQRLPRERKASNCILPSSSTVPAATARACRLSWRCVIGRGMTRKLRRLSKRSTCIGSTAHANFSFRAE